MNIAIERQRHIRHIRLRWMPARVDAVEHGKFGHATVTATLFGGMAESLYADFKPGIGGKITAVEKSKAEPEPGSSGIQIQFEVPLILEGFRPGNTVRIRPHNWPNVKPPVEDRVDGFEDRWPSPDIFRK